MKHAWAWQLALPFSRRAQVCLRTGCHWRRKRAPRGSGRTWAYAARPGLAYRLLLKPPTCSGAQVDQWRRVGARQKVPTTCSG